MDTPSYLSAKWIPLAKTAAIKIAILLWYNENIRFLEYPLEKRTIKRVEEKIGKLKLPKILKRQLENIVGPIGDHISAWMKNIGVLMIQLNLTKVVTWKADGTIDSRTTAEKAIRSGVLDDIAAFRLASCNCIVDQLFRLWPTLNLSSIPRERLRRVYAMERGEVQFWMAYLSNDMERWMDWIRDNEPGTSTPSEIAEFGFLFGVEQGNEEFGLYHMNQLGVSTKVDETLTTAAMEVALSDPEMLCSSPSLFHRIMRRMDNEKQYGVFLEYPDSVLCLLLEWPLQGHFTDTAYEIGCYLYKIDFVYVLNAVAHKASLYEKCEIFRDIFMEFWDSTFETYQEHFITEWVFEKFLRRAFDMDHIGSFFLVSDFEASLKETMFRNGCLLFEIAVGDCYWDILELIMLKYMRTKTVMLLTDIKSILECLKLGHKCSDLCNPYRFDPYLQDHQNYLNEPL